MVGPSRQSDQLDKETVISLAIPVPTSIIREQYGIPVQITPRIGQFLGRRTRSLGALRPIARSDDTLNQNINTNIEAGLKLLLSNTMSLAPKIDEIRCCILELKPDVACFTETWLHDSINDNHIYIPEFNFILKNRTTGTHGGVSLYIKNSINFKSLAHLQVNNIEVLWAWLRPKRLPRGVPCIIIGTIYHPPNADDNEMLTYLSTTLTTIESQYPGCGILLAGDFNRLNVSRLLTQFKMKQLVRSPTRGDRILDLVLTNLHQMYDKNGVEILPPCGLSDHNVVLLHPKVRPRQEGPSRKVITKRDTRISRKRELGRYLNSINWSVFDSLESCEDKLDLLTNLIINGLNHIMPIERVKVHVNDCPWITLNFK